MTHTMRNMAHRVKKGYPNISKCSIAGAAYDMHAEVRLISHPVSGYAGCGKGRIVNMEERVYKVMKGAGALNITLGVVILVLGLVSGILLIIGGSKLLAGKSKILF